MLPSGSSHLLRTAGPAICPTTVLLRIEFTASTCLHATGELLPHLSTIPHEITWGVYFCCTCPRVAPGGCYPLSLPCGARTFLTHSLSAYARDCSTCSNRYFTHLYRFRQGKTFQVRDLVLTILLVLRQNGKYNTSLKECGK